MITAFLLQSHFGYEEVQATQLELVMRLHNKPGQFWYDVDALHPTTTEWERWKSMPTPAELDAHPPPPPDMTIAIYQEDDAWPVPMDGEVNEEKRFWEFLGLYATAFATALAESVDLNAKQAQMAEKPLMIIAGISVVGAMLAIAGPRLL